MSGQEHPDRLKPDHKVTLDDVRQLMGASTPHFALQLRDRLHNLVSRLPEGDPARVLAEDEMRRLEGLAQTGEVRGEPDETEMPPLPSVSERALETASGGEGQ